MAVSVTNDFNLTPADGLSTRFYFTFQVNSESDITVFTLLNDALTPVVSGITKSINTSNIGGYVDFDVAPLTAAGDVLIRRRTPNTQPTEITDFTRYKESAIMRALDTIVFQIQQHASVLSRIPYFTEKNTITDNIIEAPQDGCLLQFSGTNGRIVNGANGSDIANAADFAAQVAADKAVVAADKAIVADDKEQTEAYKNQAEAATEVAASILAQGTYENVVTLTVADSPFTPLVAANGSCYALDMSGGAITINLSELSTYGENMRFGFLKVDSSGNVATINRGGSTDTINGSTSQTITTQYTVNALLGVEAAGTWSLSAQATDIANGSVTNAKLANMAEGRIKGKPAASGTGAPVDLTPTEARAILDVYQKSETYTQTETDALVANLIEVFYETPQDALSGSAIDFTGIPAGVNRIDVMFEALSNTADSADLVLTIGDSGGLETSGYASGCTGGVAGNGFSTEFYSTGFLIHISAGWVAAREYHGIVTLERFEEGGNTWSIRGSIGAATGTGSVYHSYGTKELSGELTDLRVGVSAGVFDGGKINIKYS